MVSFHTIRGIAIKQWAALVISFVANFNHFIKKNLRFFCHKFLSLRKLITEKKEKEIAKNHHNSLQRESCLRFFYSHVLITKFD
jgi:hypothetical protein